jgi:hypothetical protein
LDVKDIAIDRVIQSLKAFLSDEVIINKEDQNFLVDQNYLHKELEEINNSEVQFISHKELESSLNEAIVKYENFL